MSIPSSRIATALAGIDCVQVESEPRKSTIQVIDSHPSYEFILHTRATRLNSPNLVTLSTTSALDGHIPWTLRAKSETAYVNDRRLGRLVRRLERALGLDAFLDTPREGILYDFEVLSPDTLVCESVVPAVSAVAHGSSLKTSRRS